MYYGAVNMHFGWPLSEGDDLESVYYVLLTLANVRLPWLNYTADKEVVLHKLRISEVEVNQFYSFRFQLKAGNNDSFNFVSIEFIVSGEISRFN